MIPKIIHYCWFGRNPMPEKIHKCIASWRKYQSDYKIKLWNEENFDIQNSCEFVRQAYEQKKYAFVSDYVRLYALYHEGGFYFDTDVEIIRRISDDFLNEYAGYALDDNGYISVVMFTQSGNSVYHKLLTMYENMDFIKEDGTFNMEVNNTYIQNELLHLGYQRKNIAQTLSDGSKLYPDDYFHCRSLINGKLHITHNSYSIHWHTILWASPKTKIINFLRIHILVPIFGSNLYTRLTKQIKGNATTI